MSSACTEAIRQNLAAAGVTASDAEVSDACGCMTDQRTRRLTTAQILAGEVGPDDGTCAPYLKPPITPGLAEG